MVLPLVVALELRSAKPMGCGGVGRVKAGNLLRLGGLIQSGLVGAFVAAWCIPRGESGPVAGIHLTGAIQRGCLYRWSRKVVWPIVVGGLRRMEAGNLFRLGGLIHSGLAGVFVAMWRLPHCECGSAAGMGIHLRGCGASCSSAMGYGVVVSRPRRCHVWAARIMPSLAPIVRSSSICRRR